MDCELATQTHTPLKGSGEMKIEHGTIFLRSQPEDYNNESVDLKRNKIEQFSRGEEACLHLNPPTHIRIHQIGMLEKHNYFTRTLRDITQHGELTVFSW